MKNVTLTEVVRAHGRRRYLCPIRSWRQLRRYGVTLALGLPAIMVGCHLLDPGAPLAWIVVPVLLGGLLPAFAMLPGRFEVRTRFHAHHLVGTLDDSLQQLGYARAGEDAAAVRYTPCKRAWRALGEQDIAVTLHPHSAEIAGPIGTLRALQRCMVC